MGGRGEGRAQQLARKTLERSPKKEKIANGQRRKKIDLNNKDRNRRDVKRSR